MRRKVACRSIASGVVRSTSSSTPPTTCLTVPSNPHCIPAASRISRIRNAVVVFPLVPVTPTTLSSAGRIPPEPSRQRRHGRPRIPDHDLGHRQLKLPLDNQRQPLPPQPPPRRTHAHRPSPPARRKKASRRRPFGCHKQDPPPLRVRSPTTRLDGRAPARSSSSFTATILGRRRQPADLLGIKRGGPLTLLGRNAEVRKRERRDLAERRRRHRPAVVIPPRRLVDDHRNQQPRVLRRREPDEGGDEFGVGVGPVFGDLRGSRSCRPGCSPARSPPRRSPPAPARPRAWSAPARRPAKG